MSDPGRAVERAPRDVENESCFEGGAASIAVASADSLRITNWSCRLRPGVSVFEGVHRLTTVAVVRRGIFVYSVAGGCSHTLGPGSILLGNPGQEYRLSHDCGHGDDCTVVEFRPSFFGRPALGDGSVFPQSVLPPTPRVEAAHCLLLEAAGRRRERLCLDERAQLLLDIATTETRKLSADGKLAAVNAKARTSRGRARAWEACKYIERHLGGVEEPLSLTSIARAAGMSPFHFVRLFKLHLGLTPYQYVIRARIRRAVRLLRETSLSVTQVAYEVGFGDLSNFVRTFHRQVGCTPGVLSSGVFEDDKRLIDEIRHI